MKCKRCKKILDESIEGLQSCPKCGLPFSVGGKSEEVEEKKNNEVDEEEDKSLDEIEETEE
jgi:predicted  nucleic acid-binding Zn-ribbon protein